MEVYIYDHVKVGILTMLYNPQYKDHKLNILAPQHPSILIDVINSITNLICKGCVTLELFKKIDNMRGRLESAQVKISSEKLQAPHNFLKVNVF